MRHTLLHANYSPVAKWCLGVKRVLGSGKRFIVDYVTWTCPELKSAGCHSGTLEEIWLQLKQNGPYRDTYIAQNTPLVLIGRIIL